MLVAGAAVRLLHWASGRISEPERSLCELELGDWRDPEGYAVRHAARRNEAYEQRVDEWRQRFLQEAAIATAAKVGELGWDRLLVAAEPGIGDRFLQELSAPGPPARRRAGAGQLAVGAEPDAIAQRAEDDLEAVWRQDAHALAVRAIRPRERAALLPRVGTRCSTPRCRVRCTTW